MALSDILDQIKKEAELEIEKLNAVRDEEIYAIQKEFAKKREHGKADIETRIADNVNRVKHRAETFAKMQSRNKLLEAKRTLLNEVFEKSVKTLADSKGYEGILTALLKKAAKEFKEGTVTAAKGKEDETKKALKASDAPFKLADKAAKIQGGFLLSADQVEVDFSFESILKQNLWSELEMKLNQLLF